jgi:hypothetical protein
MVRKRCPGTETARRETDRERHREREREREGERERERDSIPHPATRNTAANE